MMLVDRVIDMYLHKNVPSLKYGLSVERKRHIRYLGRTRLHKSQANLIQTLQTTGGWRRSGCHVDLHLPPWPRNFNVENRLEELGVTDPPELHKHSLLHPRFRFHPWVALHKKMLLSTPILYTRVVEISLALGRSKIPHHLEIHDIRQIIDKHQMSELISLHRRGMIGFLIPISHCAADALIRFGAIARRIHVAPSGADIAAFSRIPAPDHDKLNNPHLVYLGRISPETGLHIFQAVAEQTRCRVTLVGRKCVSVNEKGPLEFLPFVPPKDIIRWYEQMDIALLPYQRNLDTVDSMSPVKLFEAMAAGRPVIASDLPVLREIITDGENGLLVQPEDPQAWIQAIRRLQKSPQLAAEIAGNARKTAQSYSWDRRAAGILEKIENANNENGPANSMRGASLIPRKPS
jgi:glycosyltransferase involved in cell wall biosynthesis